jgi:hypothetical protein
MLPAGRRWREIAENLPRGAVGRGVRNIECRLLADSVEKVVLPKVPKILKAAGAVFV